ncbi:hypothetical protein BHE74_00019568, partial [Ensete ventricosum]
QQLQIFQIPVKNAPPEKKHARTSSDISDPSTPRHIEDSRNIAIYTDVIAFTLFELETITKSFRPDYVLGEGGFGTVYKGYIDENVRVGLKSLPVAVKVLNRDGHQGHREWLVSLFSFVCYFRHGKISFGVVLLELLTGRRSVDKTRPSKEQSLVDWARPKLNDKRKLLQIIDSRLEDQYSTRAAQKACSLAYYCLSHNPKARPLMSDVVETLEPLQASGGSEGSFQALGRGTLSDYRMHRRLAGGSVSCRPTPNTKCSPGALPACRVNDKGAKLVESIRLVCAHLDFFSLCL